MHECALYFCTLDAFGAEYVRAWHECMCEYVHKLNMCICFYLQAATRGRGTSDGGCAGAFGGETASHSITTPTGNSALPPALLSSCSRD